MNKHRSFLNNIINWVIYLQTQPGWHYPPILRYGHAFLLWYTSTNTLAAESLTFNTCYHTDIELRRLHCQIGYPLVNHLHQLPALPEHNVKIQEVQYFTKYCKKCDKHDWSSSHFDFTLKNDLEFNYNVILNNMFIASKPVLHLVDETIHFQIRQ